MSSGFRTIRSENVDLDVDGFLSPLDPEQPFGDPRLFVGHGRWF
jgi:hypothetical protein